MDETFREFVYFIFKSPLGRETNDKDSLKTDLFTFDYFKEQCLMLTGIDLLNPLLISFLRGHSSLEEGHLTLQLQLRGCNSKTFPPHHYLFFKQCIAYMAMCRILL